MTDDLRDFTTDPDLPVPIEAGNIAVSEDSFGIVLKAMPGMTTTTSRSADDDGE